MDDEARVARLVGGRASGGGGLPLSEAFRAICRQLLKGPVPERLIVVNIQRELIIQRERVASTWGTWEALTADLLAQLSYAGMTVRIATDDGDVWGLGSRFKTATRMFPIPGSNLWFAIYTEEEEIQRNATDEVKKDFTHARRVLEKAGMLTSEIIQHLDSLGELLSIAPPPPAVTRRARAREEHDKPRPEGDPDVKVQCAGPCAQWKPKTEDYYELYWHLKSAGGEWYWQQHCTSCRRAAAKRRVLDRKERVRLAVTDQHENGTPTLQSVADAARTNPRDAFTDWNYLARRSLVPVPPPGGKGRKANA